MFSRKAALIYIGQTPRPDITPEMAVYLDGVCDVVETGALDPFSDEEIDEMKPVREDRVLITRRRDGAEVRVDEAIIHRLLGEAVLRMAQQGCDVCAVMCTGSFSDLPQPVPLVTADEAFHHGLDPGAGVACIGVLVPIEAQQKTFAALYKATGREIITDFASPYGDEEDIMQAAARLKAKGADCICMDCMGYSGAIAERVSAETGLRCYIPRREIAKQVIRLYSFKESKTQRAGDFHDSHYGRNGAGRHLWRLASWRRRRRFR